MTESKSLEIRNGIQLPPGEISAVNYVGDPNAGEFIDWSGHNFAECPAGGEPTFFAGERTIFGRVPGDPGTPAPAVAVASQAAPSFTPAAPPAAPAFGDPRGSMPFAGQLAPLMKVLHGTPETPWIDWDDAPAKMAEESAAEGRGWGRPNFDAEHRGDTDEDESDVEKSLGELRELLDLMKGRKPKAPKAGSGQIGFNFSAPAPSHAGPTHTAPPKKPAAGAWGPIPGGAKGGQRRKVGGKWQYRYPDGAGGWSSRPKRARTEPSKKDKTLAGELTAAGKTPLEVAEALVEVGLSKKAAGAVARFAEAAYAKHKRAKEAAATVSAEAREKARGEAKIDTEVATNPQAQQVIDRLPPDLAADHNVRAQVARLAGNLTKWELRTLEDADAGMSPGVSSPAIRKLIQQGLLRQAAGGLTATPLGAVLAMVQRAAEPTPEPAPAPPVEEEPPPTDEAAAARRAGNRAANERAFVTQYTTPEAQRAAADAMAAEAYARHLEARNGDRIGAYLETADELRQSGVPSSMAREAAQAAKVASTKPEAAEPAPPTMDPEPSVTEPPENNFETMPEPDLSGFNTRQQALIRLAGYYGTLLPQAMFLDAQAANAKVAELRARRESMIAAAQDAVKQGADLLATRDRLTAVIPPSFTEGERTKESIRLLQMLREVVPKAAPDESPAPPSPEPEPQQSAAAPQEQEGRWVRNVNDNGFEGEFSTKPSLGDIVTMTDRRGVTKRGVVADAPKARGGKFRAPVMTARDLTNGDTLETLSARFKALATEPPENNFETMPESTGGEVEAPAPSPADAEPGATVTPKMRPKPVAPKGTPRGNAERARTSESGYINDRDSRIAQSGVDTWGSARERALRWQGVDRAVEAGSVASFTFKRLAAAEGPDLAGSLDAAGTDAELAVAMRNALDYRKFPGKPKNTDKTVTIAYGPRGRERETVKIADIPAEARQRAILRGYYAAFEAWTGLYEKLDAEGREVRWSEITDLRQKFADAAWKRMGAHKPGWDEVDYPSTRADAIALAEQQLADRVASQMIRLAGNAVGGNGKTSPRSLVRDFRKRLEAASDPAAREQLVESAQGVARGEGTYKKLVEGHKFDRTRRKSFDVRKGYDYGMLRRSGGKPAPQSGPAAVAQITGEFGIGNVQWGKSVTDEERVHHAKESAAALSDLADILGIPARKVSMNGNLALAIGARGRAGAAAHYEPGLRIINLTRKNGVGTLAHEWGHFLDYVAGTADAPAKYAEDAMQVAALTSELRTLSPDASEDERDHLELKISAAADRAHETAEQNAMTNPRRAREGGHPMRQAVTALMQSEAMRAVKAQTEKTITEEGGDLDYWTRPDELFARCFEAHVQHKLRAAGRENTYLVSLRESARGTVWPTWEQSAAMAPMFDAIMKTYGDDETLFKAMRYGWGTPTKAAKMTKAAFRKSLEARHPGTSGKTHTPRAPRAERLVDSDRWGRPLRKGLHTYAHAGDDLPDNYLFEYLCGFVEEAFEHEHSEPEHNELEHGELVEALGRAVFGELLAYAPRNRNLMRAIIRHPQTAESVADLIVARGLLKPRADTIPLDYESHAAMGAPEAMAYSMTARDFDDLAHVGTRLVHTDPGNAAHLVKADPSTAVEALRGSRARYMAGLVAAATEPAVPNIAADCPIHNGIDITKAHMAWYGMTPCTCPKH